VLPTTVAQAGRHRADRNGSARRRLNTITIDQAVTGATNVLIAVLAAHVLGTESFGLFGIVFLVYATVLVAARALVCEPLLVHPEEARAAPGRVLGTGLALGLGLGAVVLLAGGVAFAWDEGLAEALFVLAVTMPLLTVQDVGRYHAVATQRPATALTLDLIWLGLVLAAVAGLLVLDLRSLSWFVLAWAGSGAITGTLVLMRRRGERIRLGFSWLGTTWTFSWRYLLAATSAQGAALVGSFLLGVISGAKALGSVVGATLMVRPFMTFQIASVAAGISEVAADRHDRPTVLRHAVRTTKIATTVAVLNTVVLLVLPDSVGELVLGDTWQLAEPLLLPTGLQIVLLGLITGPRSGLAGLRAVRKTVRIDIAGAVVLLAMTAVGAVVNGALGAVWAVAAGQACVATAWWVVLGSHLGSLDEEASQGDFLQ
jgi:O-antigen/teichoic acid export membrane protein